ncbi:MAG: hypothetical protein ACI9MR_005003 [Myxococcota bacterium]|jgi:hypothetical protein
MRAVALWLTLALGACGPDRSGPCGEERFCEPGQPCGFTEACDGAERCLHGMEGRYYGRISVADGTCVATDDAACARSSVACRVWGQCSVVPAGRIYFQGQGRCQRATRDQDFQASRDTRCAGGGTCIALRFERCDDDGTNCVVTRDSCSDSQVCMVEGRCTARDGVCVATSDSDCVGAEACRTNGRCQLGSKGVCIAGSVAACQRSLACTGRGDCGVRSGSCVACARSSTCNGPKRLCAFQDDRCIRCEDSAGCRREGLCTFAGGQCRATSKQQCEVSTVCRTERRCKPSTRGRCIRDSGATEAR